MTLTPKTTEIWAGIRNVAGMVSALRQEVETLRSQVTGYSAYQDFLRNRTSFDNLEAALQREFDPVPGLSDGDATATVDFLRDTFASYSDYKGDTNSGALSQPTYDAYRSFLINNGATELNADEHIQLLKTVFDPESAVASDAGEHTDWPSFETELENNGVGASSAAATVDDLQVVFTTVQAMDREVFGSPDWATFEQYLDDNGLTSTEASDAVADLKTAYGSTLDSTTKNSFSAFDSFAEFEQYLITQGVPSAEAATTIEKLKQNYADFDAFRENGLSVDTILSQLLSDAPDQSQTSDTGAGVTVYEEAGQTKDGFAMPKGALEIAGTKIKHTQLGSDEVETSQDEPEQGDVIISNLSVDNTAPQPGETIRISAEIQNTTSDGVDAQTQLLVDGAVVASKSPLVGASATRTVAYERSFSAGEYDVAINDTAPVTVTVTDISRV